MIDDKLTKTIIACAFKVHNTLGGGFLESVYQKALSIELKKSGLIAVNEQPITVYYEGQLVGSYFADIVVENSVILELKSLESLAKIHEVQLVNYLKATGFDLGLLINFGPMNVTIKRKIRCCSTLTG
jgi:GxxExxY protein